ncbi:uncharacterized protein LOC112346282 [Selaginella moellendorffii]|uniref:uncharacterized protein LOC112346282 n=1 Tax=Selaginella moellendorffii TaxID=88036 RepID=UPI000D1C24A9|nr:uncharacterized protein LOC112346282 [Selaginella moellendorffii]|eukprot:XP_024530664.1 uncharacterized protein LOC112346282 [Selaginella moellendorffii]
MPRTEMKARDGQEARRSWWSMLARATSSGRKAREKKSGAEPRLAAAHSDASIKERVLAKLAEPLPGELKQAARHSVDAPGVASYREDLLLSSTSSRHSTSSSTSYWTSSLDAADDHAAPLQASGHFHRARSGSTSAIHSSCSSPTSNVIARLMGLGTPYSTASPYPLMKMKDSRNPMEPTYPQGFLDEMENHLRQCDQALERIEAVMQLKKKLLYLSNSTSAAIAATSNRHDVYGACTRRDDPSDRTRSTCRHARSRSVDHTMANSRGYDHIHHHHHRDRAVMESTTPRFQHHHHRRSVSDGGTPVYRPPYDMELDMTSMERDPVTKSARARLCDPSSPPRSKTMKNANLITRAKEEIDDIIRESCFQTPHIRDSQQGKIVSLNGVAESEQPSPVSVLDNSHIDSSEDDPDCQRERESNRKRGAVVRALWADEPAAAASRRPVPHQCGDEEDNGSAIVTAMDRRWSVGIGAETKEVAARVECIILRRLVEETIVAVALACARHRGRTRGDP